MEASVARIDNGGGGGGNILQIVEKIIESVSRSL